MVGPIQQKLSCLRLKEKNYIARAHSRQIRGQFFEKGQHILSQKSAKMEKNIQKIRKMLILLEKSTHFGATIAPTKHL